MKKSGVYTTKIKIIIYLFYLILKKGLKKKYVTLNRIYEIKEIHPLEITKILYINKF